MRHTESVSITEQVGRIAAKFGIQISRTSPSRSSFPPEASDDDRNHIESLGPFTMTTNQRLWNLVNAVRYVIDADIPGDFVECGVWRGGSVMAIANALMGRGVTNRKIWLYDTFQGMTPPTAYDIETSSGHLAEKLLRATKPGDGDNVWAQASRSDVESNVRSTGYPWSHFRFVEGDVAQTLLHQQPESIALLRLDTDWYESTRAELTQLYPLLVPGGVCILDDYGHWDGARIAVDEYFDQNPPRPFLNVIDFGARTFIKPCHVLS